MERRKVRGIMRLKQDELTVIYETGSEPFGALHVCFAKRVRVWKMERIGTDV